MTKLIYTINTFTQRPSLPQIFSYIFVLAYIVVYFVCIRPQIQSNTANLVLTVMFSLTSLLTIIITAVVSSMDPTDPTVNVYRQAVIDRKLFSIENHLYCATCDSYCSYSSKHCRVCGRCVDGFDHHCVWVNNCIGKSNYNAFFAMIVIVECQIVSYIASSAWLTYYWQWKNFMGSIIAVWIVLLVASVLAFLLIHLIILHIYLQVKGITTFYMLSLMRYADQQVAAEKYKKYEEQRTKMCLNEANESPPTKIPQNKSNKSILEELRKIQKTKNTKDDPSSKIKQEDQILEINNPVLELNVQKDHSFTSEEIMARQSTNPHKIPIQESISIKIKKRYNIFYQKEQASSVVCSYSDEVPYLPELPHSTKNSRYQSIKISRFFTNVRSMKLVMSQPDIDDPKPAQEVRKKRQPLYKLSRSLQIYNAF